jgi:hypothetical protein
MFHKTIQRLLLTFGAGAMLFGALIGGSGFNRGSWVQVPATVVDVATECHMEATERGVVSKTTYTKTIACEDVELFKAIHADKTWSTSEYVVTKLDVGGSKPAEATLSVRRSDKPLPKPSQQMQVLQNPSSPERVVELGTPGREMRDGSLAILFGVALLGVYFWNRRRVATSAADVETANIPPPKPQAATGPERQTVSAVYPRSPAERLHTANAMARPQSFGRKR